MIRFVGLLLLVAACGDDSRTVFEDDLVGFVHVQGASGSSSIVSFLVDGSHSKILPTSLFQRGLNDWLVVTGLRGGRDQGKLLVFDHTGRRITSYAFTPNTPFAVPPGFDGDPGRTWQQRMVPDPDRTFVLKQADGPLLVAVAVGMNGPCQLVLLKPNREQTLDEVFSFWNRGHFSHVSAHGRYLVASGYNNGLLDGSYYTPVFAVFDLDRARGESVSPTSGQGGEHNASFAYYVRIAADRRYHMGFGSNGITREERRIEARTGSGLVYELDLDTGDVTLTATPQYRSEYFRDRIQNDKSLPPSLDTHLESLRRGIFVWRGTR